MKKMMLRMGVLLGVLLLGIVTFSVVAPVQTTETAITLERTLSGLEKKQAILPNGERIIYLDSGDTEKPAIVLLHGFGANKDNFTRIARKFTDDYRVIIPDHVGFGESSRISGGNYTSNAQAFRLRQLLKKLGINSANIGGNSMGGHISIAFAAMYPEATKSLWLLDPGGFWSAPETDIFANALKGEILLIIESREDYDRVFELAMSKPPFIPEPMLDTLAKASMANAEIEKHIAAQLLGDSIEARAKTVKVPTLLVWGDEDKIVSVKAVPVVKALMPQAEVKVMKGIGHMPMLEAPNEVAADYLEFLSTIQ